MCKDTQLEQLQARKSNIIKWAKVNGWKIKNTKDGIKCICSDCVDK